MPSSEAISGSLLAPINRFCGLWTDETCTHITLQILGRTVFRGPKPTASGSIKDQTLACPDPDLPLALQIGTFIADAYPPQTTCFSAIPTLGWIPDPLYGEKYQKILPDG
jgi:hypothetical protein